MSKFMDTRIPPLLLTLIFMFGVWLFDSRATDVLWIQVLVAAISISALLIVRLSISQFIQVKTTVNPVTPELTSSLVTGGFFKYSRNPMYLAMAMLMFAFSLYFSGWWSFIFTGVFVCFLTQFQIKPEERALEKTFGTEFDNYKKAVRRWC